MAGALRHLRPHMEPTGRTIQVRQLVGGDPTRSQMVEVRLGAREDRADYHPGYCFARRHGSFDQCGRRPRKGFVVCGQHGGGHTVRERSGERLSPQQAGALSGLSRRLRQGEADLGIIVSFFPELKKRMRQLGEMPERLSLDDDLLALTALRDVMLSGSVEIDFPEVVKLACAITTAKVQAFRMKHAAEMREAIPVAHVEKYVREFTDLLRRYVGKEKHADLLRDMKLLANQPPPARV